MVMEAFDIADMYRNPVMILGDGMIGQMMEPVEFHQPPKREIPEKTWAATGWDGTRERAIINSLYIEPEVMQVVSDRLQKRYELIKQNETRVEEYKMEDAEYCIAAYGTTARVAKSAVNKAREMGIKAGIIRPKTVWPFPSEAFCKAADQVKGGDERGPDGGRCPSGSKRQKAGGILWRDGRFPAHAQCDSRKAHPAEGGEISDGSGI